MAGDNERVLSYGDVVLRQSDVSLLDGPNYLNDIVIEFFFNYLSKEFCTSATSQTPLLLVGPTITFWLLHCPDSEGLVAAIEPLRLPERELVIFALNNNEDLETAEGGTHWTLLLFNRLRNTFEHYDSMAGTNTKEARNLMNIIKPYLGHLQLGTLPSAGLPSVASSVERRVDAESVACLPTSVSSNKCGCCDGSSIAVKEGAGVQGSRFIDQATPQQENTFDCGVYVMAIAQSLCNTFNEKKRSRSTDYAGPVRTAVSQTAVSRMRQTTLELISTLSVTEKKGG